MRCLIIQPIHRSGIDTLRAGGVEGVMASSPDMATVAREIGGVVAAITRNAGLNGDAMRSAPHLRVLGVHGTGHDRVDMDCANRLALPVVYTPDANIQSVAEHAITQMLALMKRVRENDRAVRTGNFDYRYSREFHEIAGKTLLIAGYSRTGRRTAAIAKHGFGMRVLVYSPSVPPGAIENDGYERAHDLDDALRVADIVSLHQRLTGETTGLFDQSRLARMKSTAILVNTARGAIVDADALAKAVASGQIRGAAMDVFATEPPAPELALLKVDNILLSPHTAGATEEALERTAVEVARQIIDVLNDRRPEFLLNPQAWGARRSTV